MSMYEPSLSVSSNYDYNLEYNTSWEAASSYTIWGYSIFCTAGRCYYCEESGLNLSLGDILVCQNCFKRVLDKILNPINLNRRAIDALKGNKGG